MSDSDYKETRRQEKLAQSCKDYLTAVIFYIVGFAVFMYGYGNGDTRTLPMIIGWLILGGPIFLRMLMSGSMDSLLFWKDYEVITTYSDGSKESDGGVQSSQTQFVVWVFAIVFGFFLGGLVAFVRIVWLTLKTITYYVAVKAKPAFLFSPFPVLLLFVVGLAFGLLVPDRIWAAQRSALSISTPIEKGSTLIVNRPARIYAEPDEESEVVRELKEGDTLTVTGKISKNRYIPVDHHGTAGWVGANNKFRVDIPIIATAIVTAESTVMYRIASAEKRYGRARLKKGDTVYIIGENKKGMTPIEADALDGINTDGQEIFRRHRGFVKPEDITIQGSN